MFMSVGGDTLTGVAQLAQGLPSGAAGGRPLALDLLWQVLERGQQVSRRSWGVLRVAVVELRGNTFVGRVFFGDAATGAVAWDCDCRPSDACWLALKVRQRRRRWAFLQPRCRPLVPVHVCKPCKPRGMPAVAAAGGRRLLRPRLRSARPLCSCCARTQAFEPPTPL